jgi:hypothetical protein
VAVTTGFWTLGLATRIGDVSLGATSIFDGYFNLFRMFSGHDCFAEVNIAQMRSFVVVVNIGPGAINLAVA